MASPRRWPTIHNRAQCLLPSVAGGKRGDIFQGIVQSRKLTYGVTAIDGYGWGEETSNQSDGSADDMIQQGEEISGLTYD